MLSNLITFKAVYKLLIRFKKPYPQVILILFFVHGLFFLKLFSYQISLVSSQNILDRFLIFDHNFRILNSYTFFNNL